jgi:hypothetical protein
MKIGGRSNELNIYSTRLAGSSLFVIGVVFGKFCAVGSGLNAQILEKFSMESDTLMDNLIPLDDSIEEVT